MQITSTIVISDDAFRDFATHVALSHPVFVRARRGEMYNRAMLTLVSVLGALFASDAPTVAAGIAGIGAAWSWFGWRAYPRKIADEQVAIRIETAKDKRLAARHLMATDDMISVSSDDTQTILKWSAVQIWGEGTRALFFCVNANQAVVIPKNRSTAELTEQLRAFANSRLGPPNTPLQPIARTDLSG